MVRDVVCMVVLFAACRSEPATEPTRQAVAFETVSLACVIPAGTAARPGMSPAPFQLSGPVWCDSVLETYLETSTTRIVSIVPIEYPVKDPTPGVNEAGTQELLVIGTSDVDYPLARDLKTSVLRCAEGGDGPKSCGAALQRYKALAGNAKFFVPLTRSHADVDTPAGTQMILIVTPIRR